MAGDERWSAPQESDYLAAATYLRLLLLPGRDEDAEIPCRVVDLPD